MINDKLRALGVIDEEGGAPSARTRVGELRERFGLTDSEIAKATDATARTVARWRQSNSVERGSRYDERILQLLEIIDALEPVLHDDPTGVRRYLKSRNRHLDGARPLNLLGAGRYQEVRQAITLTRVGETPKETAATRSGGPSGDPSGDDGRSGSMSLAGQPPAE